MSKLQELVTPLTPEKRILFHRLFHWIIHDYVVTFRSWLWIKEEIYGLETDNRLQIVHVGHGTHSPALCPQASTVPGRDMLPMPQWRTRQSIWRAGCLRTQLTAYPFYLPSLLFWTLLLFHLISGGPFNIQLLQESPRENDTCFIFFSKNIPTHRQQGRWTILQTFMVPDPLDCKV